MRRERVRLRLVDALTHEGFPVVDGVDVRVRRRMDQRRERRPDCRAGRREQEHDDDGRQPECRPQETPFAQQSHDDDRNDRSDPGPAADGRYESR